MQTMPRRRALACLALVSLAVQAADSPDGATILQRATEAAGGDDWARARTLMLSGRAEFWGPTGAAPRSVADHHVMWRVFDPDRQASHGAESKVRIHRQSRRAAAPYGGL